ncbi:hypothetical protein CAEBREN_32746 [Caenorhabditis brenneri]|uniref:G-protein coupled receptors family 1 profile domain-containing protein n=1 Tax=Caenorhabditis brenneri TaxID=135651 RepID=G0M962_CAEBE|nr:hypothetical protein CAEBREN_32746 [Caenorhabditis brenneri]
MGYCVESGDMYFSGYSNKTLEVLCDIFEKVTMFVYVDVGPHEFTLSVFCIIINIFHCVILSQTSMRTSSIFIIMKYEALMDIISLLYYCEETINIISRDYVICHSYTVEMISRFIALIRTLVLKYPMNSRISKLSNPKTALYLFLTIVTLCLPIQLLDFFKYDFVTNESFGNCVDYYVFTSNFFIANDNLVLKLQLYTDGITSKVIPCILFPVSTYFLIKEIRKAEFQRKKMRSTGSTSSKNTSLMVLYLAITFFIAEFPLGIMFSIGKNKQRVYF